MLDRAFVALLVCAAAGCSDRGLDPGGRTYDFAMTSPLNDLGFDTPDVGPADGCVHDPGWDDPSVTVSATNEDPSQTMGYAWDDSTYAVRSSSDGLNLVDVLYYEFFQPLGAMPPSVPHDVDLSSLSGNEVLGLVRDVDPTNNGNGGGTYYLATSGKVTVLKLDDTHPQGTVSVVGHHVELQQVDDSGNILPNGSCIRVESFDLTASYSN